MAIVLIAGQKGGGGKTTAAVTTAMYRKREGRDVLLVDGDHQKSAVNWATRRNEIEGIDVRVPCVSIYGRTLAQEVKNLATKYEDVVIDVGGHKSEEFISALSVSDRLVTPTRPSQFDLDTMPEVNQLVTMIRAINPNLDATWFLNMVPTNPSSRQAAIDYSEQVLESLSELRQLTGYLSNRSAFEITGVGAVIDEATRSESQQKGIREFQKLHKEIWTW